MKKPMFITVLIALVFLGASQAFAQSVIDVNLGTLLNEIENNSARAKQNYGGKTIRTRGRIQYIYDGYVSIGNDVLPVLLVYLPNSEIAKLQKGQTITVRGVFALLGTGLIGGLQRAVIEANPPPAAQATPQQAPSQNQPQAQTQQSQQPQTPQQQQSQPQNANTAQSYYESGFAAQMKNDFDKAIADYTQAIRLDPNYEIAYQSRGALYNFKGDYDKAIADNTQAIRINPNGPFNYSNRATAYFNKRNYKQAREDVNKALQLNPNNQFAKNLDAELKKKGY
jgi:tetratricopeptide (TPR) repeat protein